MLCGICMYQRCVVVRVRSRSGRGCLLIMICRKEGGEYVQV